jgi:hypothetical protein
MNHDLHILQHSLGVDQFGQGERYRNHFVTGPGSKDYDQCVDLVIRGLMTRRAGNAVTGGDDLFLVTPAGVAYMEQHSPKPPQLTRSAKRYRDFLAADAGTEFGEWLKRHHGKLA